MSRIITCDKCGRQINDVNFSRHTCISKDEAQIIRRLYNDNVPLLQIKQQHSSQAINFALQNCRRSMSEAVKLAHDQYPNSFGHTLSDETKQKIRQALLLNNKFNQFTNEDLDRIRTMYENGITYRKLLKIENKWAVRAALKDRKRNDSQRSLLAHKQHSESYKLSDKTKQKLSKAMILAHKEGRAHNIGSSRWNNKPSYPEKFFEKVIQNEFNDKKYVREYPCGIYALDFAWPKKKKAIEIDGQQHQRFDEYKERDKRKNEFAQSNGWTILRIEWKQFFHNTKLFIMQANDFIGK